MLREKLNIVDNTISHKVVTLQDTIKYHDNDLYLVTAKDKHILNFSYHASTVVKEYNFWLDNTFTLELSSVY